MAGSKVLGSSTRKSWNEPKSPSAPSSVNSTLSMLAGASLEDFNELWFNANRDAACCKDLLDVTLPDCRTTNVAAMNMAAVTVVRTERVRLALIAGEISEQKAVELFALIAVTRLVEHKAAILAELSHLHDVVVGVTGGDPARVYTATDEQRVIRRAHDSVRALGGTIQTMC